MKPFNHSFAHVLCSGWGLILLALVASPAAHAEVHSIDASNVSLTVRDDHYRMGTETNPDGHTIHVNSNGVLRDGKPWLPVMGEFHYSRTPENEWRDELLKMKAGGIEIVATYVFWIHHEEVEGEFDWTGRRNLRRFVELCGELGLYAVVRCGPWCHGEVRNGGLPDWTLNRDDFKTRTNDEGYLHYVRRLYGEIAQQIDGLYWKDSGPVIGIQLDNEYGGPAEHLLTLKQIARDHGMDVPMYTRTGWPGLRTPLEPGHLLPLEGAYAEGFWDRELEPMPAKYWEAFAFKAVRDSVGIGTDQLGRDQFAGTVRPNYNIDPYFTCELGGGMMPSYHRRILIQPMDVYAVAMTKLGSGGNLIGYYMYHGGTNPEGKLTTLQETQATDYWNDMPEKNYDFQAPLGQFGQVNPQYHLLRRMHLFLHDFGGPLSLMSAVMPEKMPRGKNDTETLRWAVRSDGTSAYVFVNNYQRLTAMPPKEDVQFEVKLKNETVKFPNAPVTIPAGEAFFWPVNMDLAGLRLNYATAQPIASVRKGGTFYYFFEQTPGIRSEFSFEPGGWISIGSNGKQESTNDELRVWDIEMGNFFAIDIERENKPNIQIVLLTREQADGFHKLGGAGQPEAMITSAVVMPEAHGVRLGLHDDADRTVMVFDPTEEQIFKTIKTPERPGQTIALTAKQIREAGPLRKIEKGSKGVAEMPYDEAFKDAAAWEIQVPRPGEGSAGRLLRIDYVGDVARLYLGDRLLNDQFFHGRPFDLAVERYAPEIYEQPLRLEILPLQLDAEIQLDPSVRPGTEGSALELKQVRLLDSREWTLAGD